MFVDKASSWGSACTDGCVAQFALKSIQRADFPDNLNALDCVCDKEKSWKLIQSKNWEKEHEAIGERLTEPVCVISVHGYVRRLLELGRGEQWHAKLR